MAQCALTGKKVQFGHNVSHSKRRTNRQFKPNIQKVSLSSEALGCSISLKVCVRALRTVQKRGGLDAFLLGTDDAKLGEEALRLKRRVKKKGQGTRKSA
ncbi:MAG: 50S ribosomal protein L28 [Deltaproteobacteria bacterium]|nr:50S ribosomal protein L28 [Deltaproteobacteria bacterium]MBW2419629.1 50S ribosomal protein L28 [Deltaproteobacteria bacterium]